MAEIRPLRKPWARGRRFLALKHVLFSTDGATVSPQAWKPADLLSGHKTIRHIVQSTMQRGAFKLPSRSPPGTTTGQTSGCLIVNDYNSSTGKETVSIIPG